MKDGLLAELRLPSPVVEIDDDRCAPAGVRVLLVGENGSGKSTWIEVGEHGFRRTAWEDLDLVFHWRRYMTDPRAYLRHVIDEETASR